MGAQWMWEGYSLRTSLCSLVIRLAEKAQGSAHVQKNYTNAYFCFFLMLHSQRMSCVFLSLDKGRSLLLWNQSSSSKYRLGEMWSRHSLSGLSTSRMPVNDCPILCGQWLSISPVSAKPDEGNGLTWPKILTSSAKALKVHWSFFRNSPQCQTNKTLTLQNASFECPAHHGGLTTFCLPHHRMGHPDFGGWERTQRLLKAQSCMQISLYDLF